MERLVTWQKVKGKKLGEGPEDSEWPLEMESEGVEEWMEEGEEAGACAQSLQGVRHCIKRASDG